MEHRRNARVGQNRGGLLGLAERVGQQHRSFPLADRLAASRQKAALESSAVGGKRKTGRPKVVSVSSTEACGASAWVAVRAARRLKSPV